MENKTCSKHFQTTNQGPLNYLSARKKDFKRKRWQEKERRDAVRKSSGYKGMRLQEKKMSQTHF